MYLYVHVKFNYIMLYKYKQNLAVILFVSRKVVFMFDLIGLNSIPQNTQIANPNY